jgi:ubiquinone/menaquinone biosynthesis C-methylase UbiE
MNHQDHVRLLRKGVPAEGGVWADLGAGAGAFTLALAELLGASGQIIAIDKDQASLSLLEQSMRAMFPASNVRYVRDDFTRPLTLPQLDGIVMANSLHYVRDKDALLKRIHGYLRPRGRLLLVEYNADRGNPWVPYPLSYQTWEGIASRNGYSETHLLEREPSRFLREMYSAASMA